MQTLINPNPMQIRTVSKPKSNTNQPKRTARNSRRRKCKREETVKASEMHESERPQDAVVTYHVPTCP